MKEYMKKIKLFVLPILVYVSTITMAFASCDSSAYGTTGSTCSNSEFNLEKTVRKSGASEDKKKITGINKGETFTFEFKVENKTSNEVTLNLEDNLPSEFEKVSGIGYTEEVKLNAKSRKTLEMVVKVKDSEFVNKSNFEKCVVNKAYISQDRDQKDSSTATVCFGEGVANTLPKTGPENIVLGAGALSLALGFALKKFRK
jgi:hypothetical protein